MNYTAERAWVGVDPGKAGCAALVDQNGEIELHDFQGVTLAAECLRDSRSRYRLELVALEAVHGFKGQGVSSTFAFGRNAGAWEGLLAGLGIPFVLVKPQAWQKGLFAKADGKDSKTQSLSVARRLYPDADLSLKRHHNRSDALLLADYARRRSAT